MNTLLLDRTTWDLTLTALGDIAVASKPYALAQDAASAIRLFKGELWYNTTPGIPYFENVLGRTPHLAYVKAQFVKAALTVPEVVAAKAFITGFDERTLHGQVQVTDKSGVISAASF
jgi:hypothetical protein